MSVFVPSGLRVTQEVRYGASGQTLTWICEVDGQRVTPGASPEILIFQPGAVEDSSAIVTGTGTVSGTGFTYALDATDTAAFFLGRNFRAKATWTNGGKTYTTTVIFSVVRNPVNQQFPCNENALLAIHVRAEEALDQVGRLGYSGAFYIREAWNEVVRFLESTHTAPAEVMPRDDLNALLLPLARAKFCRSVMSAPNDMWDALARHYQDEYEAAKKNTVLRVARGDTNVPSQENAYQQPTLSAAPDRFAFGRRGHGGW